MPVFNLLPGGLHLRLILALLGVLGLGPTLPEVEAQDLFVPEDPDATPVLLVPGWGDQPADVEPFRQELIQQGWLPSRVSALGLSDPFGSNKENAREIARGVEALMGMTGAREVDVVAHSMGGLALRHFLLHEGGGEQVRRVVFLGTPHRGTLAAVLAWGDGGREMVPGSDFLERINVDGGLPEGMEALSIRTPVDLRVIPGSSAMLPRAWNLEICCPTHNQLVVEERTVGAAINFLRHGPAGVPDAEQPGARPEWGGSGVEGLESWGGWGDRWLEWNFRRWLLPY